MDKLRQKAITKAERIQKFVTNASKTAREKRDESFFNARFQLLETYWSQYCEAHEEIIETIPPAELQTDSYFAKDIFSDVECAHIEAQGWLNEQFKSFAPKAQDSTLLNSTVQSAVNTAAIKLPKIDLPTFNGNYLEWPSFNDTFVSLIHENDNLTSVQKMHYLKSAITGEASKLLQHYTITSSNYESAWQTILNRYKNTRLLVNSNLHSLITLQPMSGESSMELRRVFDTFMQAVRTLENLSRPVEAWDDWLVYFLGTKLDHTTRKDWETSLESSTEVPSFETLRTFLEGRLHALSAIKDSSSLQQRQSRHVKPFVNKTASRSYHTASTKVCPGCKRKHPLLFCPQFRTKSVEERIDFLKVNKLCANCLKAGHSASSCTSNYRCQRCQQPHHTMIHRMPAASASSHPDHNTSSLELPSTSTVAHSIKSDHNTTTILLATAVVFVRSPNGRMLKVRALLDQGSESSFITQALSDWLNLPKRRADISVLGVGQCEAGTVHFVASHEIISTHDPSCSYTLQSLVLPTLTALLPAKPISKLDWPHLANLRLADPDYETPARIDLILGAEIVSKVLLGEVRRGPSGTPIAQATSLGWILSGPVENDLQKPKCKSLSLHTTTTELNVLLRRFWEVEEPPATTFLTPEELACEDFFQHTHSRDVTGRYIVRLPIRTTTSELGSSKDAAISSLKRMERRFEKNSDLKRSYSEFMTEYLTLNHMELADNEEPKICYYLPHHAVLKPSSTTTKLRVVFNASQETSSGKSLNDILHVGPKLQNDIFQLLMRWRVYPFVFTADAEKMFRQILVDKADVDLQRILWRSHPSEPIQAYRLLTVTYGTACAPYLACKVLNQLAEDHQTIYPEAAKIIKEQFYVDDALFGASDVKTACSLRDELSALLRQGGFRLRKWLANHPELLEGIPDEDREASDTHKIVSDTVVKALGIHWIPTKDVFRIGISFPATNTLSKRSVLADISRLYDPLGWLSPVTVKAKILLQRLWMDKIGWDDEIPDDLKKQWLDYKADLQHLSNVEIGRWIGTTNAQLGLELHGFCDASLNGYGAVVYLRITHNSENNRVSLLAAKTKVSPIRAVSLPRLELCGAALLAELVAAVQRSLPLKGLTVYLWSDSTTVLAWLREHPSRWKVFVANRTAFIHEKVPDGCWRHVPSADNPADCTTRGIFARELANFSLWWTGPPWLQRSSAHWPQSRAVPPNELPPEEVRAVHLTTRVEDVTYDLYHRYSDLQKLLRITAYCYRMYCNTKAETRCTGDLKLAELDRATNIWIKLVQGRFFRSEIDCLKRGKVLPNNSGIRNLNPMIDTEGILRVGGRLKNALLSYDEKYPVILPKESHLTHLIINYSHKLTLHGGVQATLQHLRSKYWLVHGRRKVRQSIRNCIICCRHKASTKTQVMGDLPADRVTPSKPFLHSGVDYAGPFNIKPTPGRNRTSLKCYVAIFICFATRAAHLELVMDLTTEAFISAFRRFIGRRGRCAKLYSDNATTFVCADRHFQDSMRQLLQDPKLSHLFLQDSTEWHFIPPGSPHFGGLWEAGVKALKHHFRRIVGSHTLDIEAMQTLLVQIEACMDSRPICAISDDPNDTTALTPGHFLVGESLLTMPTPSVIDIPTNRLNRWQLVQSMVEHLWRRWRHEYVHHLQLRAKWQSKEQHVKINDLALIKEENLPPAKWSLGRVVELHPGADGQVRVVTLRYKDGYRKRAIAKICVLPVNMAN